MAVLGAIHLIFVSLATNVDSVGDYTFTHNLDMPDWCYTLESCNEDNWEGDCISNTHQSPVDLPKNLSAFHSSHETIHDFPKSSFVFPGFELDFRGHTVQLKPGGDPVNFTREVQVNFTVTYTLYGMDFHWGHHFNQGSEHTYHGKAYPMEIHLAFYDASKFTPGNQENLPRYTGDKDILVIGIWLDIASVAELEENVNESQVLAPVIDKLHDLRNSKPIQYPDELNLTDLFTGNIGYKYQGSFTTPKCREVEWWIIRKPLIVPLEHIQAFRRSTVDGLRVDGNNFRKPKEMHLGDLGLLKLVYV